MYICIYVYKSKETYKVLRVPQLLRIRKPPEETRLSVTDWTAEFVS